MNIMQLRRRSSSEHRFGRTGGAAVLAVAMVVTLGACASNSSSVSSSSSPPLEQLTLVLPSPSVPALYEAYVAQKKGYFKDVGLDVAIRTQNGTEPTVQALASGQADIIEVSTSSVLPAAATRAGFDPTMFFLTESRAPFDTYAPSTSKIKTAADMKGKVLGVGTINGAETLTAKALLGKAGLKPNVDYKILPVGSGAQAIAALQRGDIDAYAGGIGDVAIIQARGIDLVSLTPVGTPGTVGFGYWALSDTITKKQAPLEKFTEAITKAHEYINGDATSLVSFTKGNYPDQVSDANVTLALAKAAISLRSPEGSAPFGQIDPKRWTDWYNNLVTLGTIPTDKASDPAKFFTNSFMPKS